MTDTVVDDEKSREPSTPRHLLLLSEFARLIAIEYGFVPVALTTPDNKSHSEPTDCHMLFRVSEQPIAVIAPDGGLCTPVTDQPAYSRRKLKNCNSYLRKCYNELGIALPQGKEPLTLLHADDEHAQPRHIVINVQPFLDNPDKLETLCRDWNALISRRLNIQKSLNLLSAIVIGDGVRRMSTATLRQHSDIKKHNKFVPLDEEQMMTGAGEITAGFAMLTGTEFMSPSNNSSDMALKMMPNAPQHCQPWEALALRFGAHLDQIEAQQSHHRA